MLRPLTFLAALLPLFPLAAHAQRGVASPAPDSPYLRYVEEREGRLLRIETAVRTLVPLSGEGPEISLVSVAHIGEQAFFEELQGYLDELDLVIYEGVRPPGTGLPGLHLRPLDDEGRARVTAKRIRFLATMLEQHFEEHDAYPLDFDALIDSLPVDRLELIDVAFFDAWDEPLHYVLASPVRRGKFDLVSLGADRTYGGEGVAADLFFTDQAAIAAAERGGEEGIQRNLARAAGLVFQRDAMERPGSNWINRDLSVDQLQERLAAEDGGEIESLMALLGGEGWMSKVAGGVLDIVGMTSTGSSTLELMLIEVLGRAAQLQNVMPEEFRELERVVIDVRNQAVLDEVGTILARGNAPGRVGIFYGEGHMAGLERGLRETHGYRLQYEYWFPALELDLDADGGFGIDFVRKAIRKALDAQMSMVPKQDG